MKSKILFFFLIVFLLFGIIECGSNSNTNFKNNDIYKTSSDEYQKLIGEIANKTVRKTDKFSLNNIQWKSPYVNINFYEIGNLDEATFETEKMNIYQNFYRELSKNSYKSGGLFATDFEYISIAFYKNDGNGNYKMKDFKQIDVYKL